MSGSRPYLSLMALVLSSGTVFAQGTVHFANASSILSSPPDRLIRFLNVPGVVDGTPVSTNLNGLHFSGLCAQLFYGATGDETSMVAVQRAPATFRSSTSVNVGAWFGGTRTLIGFFVNDTVNLQVRVWDINLASDWSATQASTYAGMLGKSAVFTYTLPSSAPSGDEFDMYNFQGFSVSPNVPEPSALALFALSVFCFATMTRQRQQK